MLNVFERINALKGLDVSVDVPDAFPEHANRMLDVLEQTKESIQHSENLLKEAEKCFLEAMSVYDRYICLLEQGSKHQEEI